MRSSPSLWLTFLLLVLGNDLGAQTPVPSGTPVLTAPGVYRLSGVYGGVVVDAPGARLTLILEDAKVSATTGPALWIKAAALVELQVRGSGSVLVDAPATSGPSAAVYSEADLLLTGTGTAVLRSVNDALRSKGSITVRAGAWDLRAGGDGLQADKTLTVEAGRLTVNASAKGLKAGESFTIAGGQVEVCSQDDALHSDRSGVVSGGTLVLSTEATATGGGQGIKVGDADSLTISGGTITVTKSYEGQSGGHVVIQGGVVKLAAEEDGISVSAGNDRRDDDGSTLSIEGGSVEIDARGDGIDVNGSARMSGGTVFVQGSAPGEFNAPLDFNGRWVQTGGFLVAVGSAAMTQAPSRDSTQTSVALNLTAPSAGGLSIQLKSAQGSALNWTPTRAWQALVVSSPSLARQTDYELIVGGKRLVSFKTSGTVTVWGTPTRFRPPSGQ